MIFIWLAQKLAALRKKKPEPEKPWLKKSKVRAKIRLRLEAYPSLFDETNISHARLLFSPPDNPKIKCSFVFVIMMGQLFFDSQFNETIIDQRLLLAGVDIYLILIKMGEGEYYSILTVADLSGKTIAVFTSVQLALTSGSAPIFPQAELYFVKA